MDISFLSTIFPLYLRPGMDEDVKEDLFRLAYYSEAQHELYNYGKKNFPNLTSVVVITWWSINTVVLVCTFSNGERLERKFTELPTYEELDLEMNDMCANQEIEK